MGVAKQLRTGGHQLAKYDGNIIGREWRYVMRDDIMRDIMKDILGYAVCEPRISI